MLTAMARPGTIQQLQLAAGQSPAASLLAALVDHEVCFCLVNERAERSAEAETLTRQLAALTGSVPTPVRDADFVVSSGPLPAAVWGQLRRGTPAYPDRSATVIYVLPAVGILLADMPCAVLTVTGPGIATNQRLLISGLNGEEFAALAAANADFPLGVDVMLADWTGRLACIPRSSTLRVDAPTPPPDR
jgi:alpha-D-ribose 1-methylphosphonate 5-triphosphate synthase subunit PhnH